MSGASAVAERMTEVAKVLALEVEALRAVITAAYDELHEAGHDMTSPAMLALADEVDR